MKELSKIKFRIPGRRYGQTHAMILSLTKAISNGGSAGVLGVVDPKNILDRLKDQGVNAEATAMEYTPQPRVVYNLQGDLVGYDQPVSKKTGYVFREK